MAEPETAPETAPRLAAAPLPAVSLVIPVFNEEQTLEEVYRRSAVVLEGLERPFEVIVVDDGSRDGTWELVERLAAEDPRLRAVRFKKNFGQHPAMHAGLVRARGDVVVTMDADLQNVPEDLPRLIAAVEEGRAAAAFLLNAPSLAEVRRVCLAGELMPEKSTYFYPKLLSGLVLDLVGPPWV